MTHELMNRFILLLKEKNYAIPPTVVYQVITDSEFNAPSAAKELERLGLLDIGIGGKSQTYSTYILNMPSRRALENLPKQYENDPYGYFLDEERRTKEREQNAKWWESENARTQFENYPIIDRRSRSAIFWSKIAAIGAIMSALIMLFQWKCGSI